MNTYQDLLERLQAAQSDKERAWITLQFNLTTQPVAVRAAVTAAAILHWFDRKILNFMLESELSEAEFRTLISLPYIEEFPGRGWNVHEKTRDLLRDKLWQEDRTRYRKLSRRAAALFRKHSTDQAWQAEAAYHALLSGERKAEDTFINLSTEWHNRFQYAALEALLRPVLNEALSGRLSGLAAAWANYRRARLDYLFSRNNEAKATLHQALAVGSDDQLLIAHCKRTLGDVHSILSELPQAQECYQEALKIYRDIGDQQGEANCIHALGEVHAQLAEWLQARVRYQEALPICRDIGDRQGEANCISALGRVHMALYEFSQARQCYQAALAIYRDTGERIGEANCILSLGVVHASLAEFQQARQCYMEVLPICRDIGDPLSEANCIKALGNVAAEEGELDEALAHFHDAVQRYEKLKMTVQKASCYDSIGIMFTNNRHYSDAIAAYDQAIEFNHDVAYYTNRAEPYMHLGDFATAQRDLDAAAALNPDYNYLHFNQGRLALWQGHVQTALEQFDRALAQRPECGEFHLWRALALALCGETWDESLQAGLTRTYLTRQIRETVEAADKLVQTYGENLLQGPRKALQVALAARN